jgi:hypothetical protein
VGGIGVPFLVDHFVELCVFPDLIQEELPLTRRLFELRATKLHWRKGKRSMREIVSQLLIFIIPGFEVDNKSTAYICLWKASHQLNHLS